MHAATFKLPLCASLLLSAATSLAADDRIDLKRITPVAPTEEIPVADFFRPAMLQEPKLNPSGTHIAAIITAAEDRHQLLVYELKTQKVEIVGGPGDSDVSQVNWLNDRRLVYQLSKNKLYGIGLFAADVGSLDESYPLLQYYGSSLVGIPTDNRLRPLVWNRWDGIQLQRDLGVAEVDTDIHSTGKAVNLIAAGADWSGAMDARANNERHIDDRYPLPEQGTGVGYLADKNGRLAFAYAAVAGQTVLERLVAGHWEKCPINLDHTTIVACGNEPGQLVALGPSVDGKPRPLQFLDAATGKFGDILLPVKAFDFTGWVYRDPVSHDIIGAMSQRSGPHAAWFTDLYANLQKILNGYFPGLYVQIVGSNEAQNLFLVAAYSDRQPVKYSWIDLEKHTGGLIKESAPWIDPKRMQPESVFKFKTRDGRALEGYLTLPAGASRKNPPPLVVVPHGGPWVRDYWGYNGESEFLASRGYAVLRPSYRGTLGCGWMFPEEDEYDFRKMHDDVTDATKALVATGLVDATRVAIMGGSFGGYLALSGVVNEPALYRCAVTISGVFDWEQLIQDKKSDYNHFGSPEFAFLVRKLGDPKKQREKFDQIAPVRHVNQVRVPVFVSHGGYDPIADIGQSTRLISELEKNHVVHESLIVREETHGMAHLTNDVELYSRIERFLATNLAPLPPQAAAGGAP
jgi:dienelactone hydrolase